MSIKFITIIKVVAIAICFAPFGAQAGIASRIAAEVAPVIGSKVSRKAIHEQNKDKPSVSEFDRLANAIRLFNDQRTKKRKRTDGQRLQVNFPMK